MSKSKEILQQHRQANQNRNPVRKTEYTDYDEYIQAQKEIHEEMFAKSADICQLCGYPMDYQGHKLTEWEKKWSVHEVCRNKMSGLLDRETGIARERRRR